MAPRTMQASSLGAQSTLCRRCLKLKITTSSQQKRHIGLKVLQKEKLAAEAWEVRANRITEGLEKNLWDVFKERGFVKDIAGTETQVWEIMRKKRIGAYVGVDPTAPSLHVGHLVPLMALFWMYLHGYRAMSVIGGATARVGDPEGRMKDRERIANSDAVLNITKTHYQLKRIWMNVEVQGRRFGYEKNWAWRRGIMNNTQWYNSLSFTVPVHRLFSSVRVSTLLSRDTAKTRMASGAGMPLDEFIYPLMQAWDWWHLYSSPLGIQMQIGGSDQFGNIVSGVDAVKHLRDTELHPSKRIPDTLLNTPIGFTTPLLTDSSGAKFGKSAGNAVWLDPFMTSSFDLYKYFMRRPDTDVENLLRLLTFHPMEKISEIMAEHSRDPSKRVAQHILAYEVVALVHSDQLAKDTQMQHRTLYATKTGNTNNGTDELYAVAPSSGQPERASWPDDIHKVTPTVQKAAEFKVDIELPESLILGKSIQRILHASGLASSASDAHRLTLAQGAYIGGSPGQPSQTNKGMPLGELTFTPVKAWFPSDTKNFLIAGKLLILRRGKHFIRVVKMISDEEWKASGKIYPGEPGTGKVRRLKAALQAIDPTLNEKDMRNLRTDVAKLEESALETPLLNKDEGVRPVSWKRRGDYVRPEPLKRRDARIVALREQLKQKVEAIKKMEQSEEGGDS
ncbi:tRNA synthetase class I [Pseudomassariella vexata]|uniref:Tyrosine--tRNA ligase n=1 Tax=Pseudomassariella vexata TaxID=1141098 RepID=A0A1Y2EAM2_9PEZI|nr:tRNA synthetase class I [Pseudomassariella vexata]ORY68592.1 tRNA synthetase class I [Pseudomassariella vexata]